MWARQRLLHRLLQRLSPPALNQFLCSGRNQRVDLHSAMPIDQAPNGLSRVITGDHVKTHKLIVYGIAPGICLLRLIQRGAEGCDGFVANA
jgi:hypothetical protein